MQQAGVGDKFHAGGFRRVNHVAVLDGALADFAGRDQQEFVHALQGGGQRGFIAVVGLTNHYALWLSDSAFAGLRTIATTWPAGTVVNRFSGRAGQAGRLRR